MEKSCQFCSHYLVCAADLIREALVSDIAKITQGPDPVRGMFEKSDIAAEAIDQIDNLFANNCAFYDRVANS